MASLSNPVCKARKWSSDMRNAGPAKQQQQHVMLKLYQSATTSVRVQLRMQESYLLSLPTSKTALAGPT